MSGARASALERTVETALQAHAGAWALLAATLRALADDEQAGEFLRRRVREAMACALTDGYEGHGPVARRPGIDHHHKASAWLGMQLLRDVGPRGLVKLDWTAIGRRMTRRAGPHVAARRANRAERPPRR